MSSLRIMLEFVWPDASVDRLWDGAGPFVDGNGNVWRGDMIPEGLDAIEQAINGEAYTLSIGLPGVQPEVADFAWLNFENDNVIGAVPRILIQECDDDDQPVGSPEVKFTGRAENIQFAEKVDGDRPLSTVALECSNRFTMRRLKHGAVLSDTDQRARSAVLNPAGNPDRIAERVPLMADKTVTWPRFN